MVKNSGFHEFEFVLFVVLWISTFVSSPIIAWLIRKEFLRYDRSQKKKFLVLHFAVIAMAILMVFTKWSLRGLIADALLLVAAYVAYSNLIFLFSIIRPKILGWTMTFIGMIPTVLGLLFGGTFLGLLFMLDSMVPHQEGTLSRNYSYRIIWYGGAMVDHNGAILKVSYHPTLFPFLEKEIVEKNYIDSDCDSKSLFVDISDNRKQILVKCKLSQDRSAEIESIPAQ